MVLDMWHLRRLWGGDNSRRLGLQSGAQREASQRFPHTACIRDNSTTDQLLTDECLGPHALLGTSLL